MGAGQCSIPGLEAPYGGRSQWTFPGDFFPQLHFDLVGVFGSSKTQQIGDTDTVGIANIGRLAVDITTDEIGCFAADAGGVG